MNLSELIETIRIETTVNEKWEDPNYLSELLVRLASYYSTLGKPLAEAEQNEDFAKLNYELVRERFKVERVEAGDSVALAESKAAVQVKLDKDEWANSKYKARLLFLTRQSLDKTMDALRSRLSYIKMDREGARIS